MGFAGLGLTIQDFFFFFSVHLLALSSSIITSLRFLYMLHQY